MEDPYVRLLDNDTWFNVSDDERLYQISEYVRLVLGDWDPLQGNDTVNRSAREDDGLSFSLVEHVQIILPYAVILLLAVLGNVLVIVTLAVNKRMRTVTNVFLLNLAISDLLLGVFCMPFTLFGVLLRAFVFGEFMCKMIPFLQAVSVSVSAWSLVAMSVERYYAICHPLKSRQWQTFSHAKRMIGIVWVVSLIYMLPIAVLSELQPMRGSSQKYKCRERWPTDASEKIFNILIDIFLLIIPLAIMMVTYSLISYTLWKALNSPIIAVQNGSSGKSVDSESVSLTDRKKHSIRLKHSLSCTHTHKSLTQKKRVIRMLFVVVLEFFISWTPLYIINTISLFDPMTVYLGLGYHGIGFFQLLAYTSSCCNPITYCFMNTKFRQNFIAIFGCRGRKIRTRDGSGNHTQRSATSPMYRENEIATTAFR